MATTIRELLVRLGVDADTKKVAQFDKALATARGTMVRVTGAAILAAGAIVGVGVATARAGDEAAKAAKRIGVTAEEMQELAFAANIAGADMASVEVAFRRQAVAARDAVKTGTSPAALSYKKIGVSVRDASGAMKGQLRLFKETANGLRGLKTDTERMAVVNDLFGRGGAKLLPLLNEGAAGIEEMMQRARDLGLVMDEEAIAASESFNDRMTEMGAILKGVRNQIGIALIPIFTRFVERIREWFLSNRAVIQQRIDKVVDGIREAVDFLGRAFDRVNTKVAEVGGWSVIFDQVRKVVVALGTAFAISRIVKFVGVVSALLGGLSAAAAALGGPVVAGVVAFVGFLASALLIGEDFLVFLRGGESLIGRFLAAFGLESEARAGLLDELNQLRILGATAAESLMFLAGVFASVFAPEIAKVNGLLEVFGGLVFRITEALVKRWVASTQGAAKEIAALTAAIDNPRKALAAFVETIDDLLAKVDALRGTQVGKLLGATVGATPGGRLAAAGGRASRGFLGGLSSRLAGAIGPTPGAVSTSTSTSTSTTTVGGARITVNTAATDPAAVAAEVVKADEAARRKAFAAAQGGER